MKSDEAILELRNVALILEKIEAMDDYIIEETENLRRVLLMLKIESARLKGTGIQPIAESLEKSIRNLHDSVGCTLTENRKSVTESLTKLSDYIKESAN